MPKCPDCGGVMKYKPPFLVCQECGLSVRRSEYEKLQEKVKKEFIEEIGLSPEEKERQERAKRRAYYNWLLKREEEE